MLAVRIGGGDEVMLGSMHINVRLNYARRIVLQLAQFRTENVGPGQRVGSGDLVSRQPRLAQSLAIQFTLHGVPGQVSGDGASTRRGPP